MRLNKFKNFMVVLLIWFYSASVFAVTAEKEEDILKLLQVMGNASIVEDVASSTVSYAISQEKKRYQDLPKKVEHVLSESIYKAIMDRAKDLDAIIVPIYDKYYTHKEIRELTAFFQTPIGRKYSSVTMAMSQELLPVFQEWSRSMGTVAAERARKELAKHGYR